MTLHIHLLGQFRAHDDERPLAGFEQKRLQALLAFLLLKAPAPIPREQIAFAFWPDSTDEQALANLRNLLHRLRDALPENARDLGFDRRQVWWQDDGTLWVDVAAFNAALAEAASAEAAGNPAAACRALEAAIACYAGDLLPACYDDWITVERERLHQAYLRALNHLVTLLEAQHAYDDAIRYAQRLIQQDPLHEPAVQRLMRLHLAAGNRAEALRAYHAYATLLRRELGVDPSGETQAIHLVVLHADEAPVSVASPLPAMPVLVGRQAEWAQLLGVWRRAAAGHPQMALLDGETGIGKTRLLEELIGWVTARQQTAVWVGCTATERALPYAPVAALLRIPALNSRLARLDVAWLSEISRLLPELAMTHPDLPSPGPMTEPWQRQRLFQALAQAILSADPQGSARAAPLLLCLDDLQWADPDTLDWLLYLLDAAGAAPLLVLGTTCCCELEADHPVEALAQKLQRRGRLTRIALGALPPAAAAELARQAAGRDLSADETDRLYRETEGNPLFVVEMAQAGLDLRGQTDSAQTSRAGQVNRGSDQDPPLPPKVEAAIRRRLAGLSAPARALAQTAAILGRTFTVDVVMRVSGLDEDALLLGLDELWQQRIVRDQGTAAYDFAHDKLRAVVCADLSPARRQQLHRRAAEALEALVPAAEADGHRAAQLARHYLEAGDERKALSYLVQAGDQARVLYAHGEAIAHYERAVALQRRLGMPQAAARTLMKLGLTHHDAFDYAAARQAYEAGFELWRHAPAPQPYQAATRLHTLRSHWGSLTTLDPGLVADFNTVVIVEQLFTGLAEHGPDAEVLPALAASWDVAEGGRRYVFHLREGLCWSDGAALTAADFVAGWQRVLHPATKASCAHFLYDVQGARAYHRGEADDPAALGVYAPDARMLVVTLERPAGYFPHLLANPVTYPIPRHALAAHGAAWAEPDRLVSNGPYRLTDWQRGSQMTLTRNPHYHARFSGNVARVELALERDAATIMAAYEADDLDVVQLDYRFSLAERHALRERYVGDLASAPRFATWFLGFDPGCPPLDDPRVRRALAMAVDRELLAGAVLQSFATPAAGGLTPPGVPGHVAGIGLPFDPATARRLLAEAGFPDGRGFPALPLVGEQTIADQAGFICEQWQRHLGIGVAQEAADWPAFVRRMEAERLPIYYSAWRADYPDPDNFLRVALAWRKTQPDDAEFTALVERARGLTDPAGRLAAYAQAERRLIESAAVVPLNYRRAYFLIKPRVTHYPASGLRPWFWQDVVIEASS